MSYDINDYTADEQAYIQSVIAAGGVDSFSGDDTCNDLDGGCSWNGESHRCNCGNRRMSWTPVGDGKTCYAEAY